MTDIIASLRAPYYWMSGSNGYNEEENDAPFEAANEIERLRARIAALEAALAPLVALAGVIRQDAEKATPGPWHFVERHPNNAVANVDGPDPSKEVATLYGPDNVGKRADGVWEDHPIRRANGRLIAAAPDMVAAILAAADAAITFDVRKGNIDA